MAIYEFPHTRNYEDDTTKLLMKIVERLDGITPELENLNADVSGLTEQVLDIRSDVNELIEAIDAKMETYRVEVWNIGSDNAFFQHIKADGTSERVYYADLIAKYNDPTYFLYCEYPAVGLTLIPSLPPMEYDQILEFSCNWEYSGVVHQSRVIVNSDNEIKYNDRELAQIKGEFTTLLDTTLTEEAMTIDVPIDDITKYSEMLVEVCMPTVTNARLFRTYILYNSGGVELVDYLNNSGSTSNPYHIKQFIKLNPYTTILTEALEGYRINGTVPNVRVGTHNGNNTMVALYNFGYSLKYVVGYRISNDTYPMPVGTMLRVLAR